MAEFVIAAGELEWAGHDRFAGHTALINAIGTRIGAEIQLDKVTYGRLYRDKHGAVARVARLGRGVTAEQIEPLIHEAFAQSAPLEIEMSA